MKRITALLMCLGLLFGVSALWAQAAEGLDTIDMPYAIQYSVGGDGTSERITISCALTDDFAALTADESVKTKHGISLSYGYVQLDYRIDGGDWQYTKEWDTKPEASTYGSSLNTGETAKTLDLLYLTNESAVEAAGDLVVKTEDGKKVFDFENHSLEFRLRTVLTGRVEMGNFIMQSDWTEPVAVERNAPVPEIPKEFEAPVVSNARVEYMADTDMPYISFEVKTPESIKIAQTVYSAHVGSGLALVGYIYADGNWERVSISSSGSYYSNETKSIYLDDADLEDESLVKIKLCYMTYDDEDNQIYSEETEVIKLTVPRWVEGKGLLHAKCTTCGICTPVFGNVCMFVLCGISAAVIVVAAVIIKMQADEAAVRRAEAEEERQRKLEAERAAYNAAKQAKKQKNKKG